MNLGLRPEDRILVLGSSGWFGREFAAMSQEFELPNPILSVPGPSSGVHVSDSQMLEFNPTVVLNFAFLTRERVEVDGVESFTVTNTVLTERFLECARSDSVRMALTVSSGAAVTEPGHPYGELKLAEEQAALALASHARSVVVIRAYSVTGGHVRRPRDYAFSDFILQAAAGSIEVRARHPVWRRYCAVSDTLMVALRRGLTGHSGVLETGGQLVELGELAYAVANIVMPGAPVRRGKWESHQSSSYCSSDVDWREWAALAGVMPMDLEQQIRAAARILIDLD